MRQGSRQCPSERLGAAAGGDLQRDPDQRERGRDARRAARAGQLQRAAHRARGRAQRHRRGRARARDPRAARHAGGVRRHRAREGRLPLRRRLPGRIRPALRRGVRRRRRGAAPAPPARPQRQRPPAAEDRHAAARGPGDRGPGRQGPDRHQGRAHHLARLDRGPAPRAHALVAAGRRLAAHRFGSRAAPPARRGEPRPPAGPRLHHPHRRRGRPRRRHRGRRELPDLRLGRDPDPQGRGLRARAALQRALAAAARDPRHGQLEDAAHRGRRHEDLRRDEGLPVPLRRRSQAAARALPGLAADLRPLRDRVADRRQPRQEGLAQVRRLPGDRPERGADRDRRQHRALRRQARPRGDRPQDQSRGGATRSSTSSASATSAG